MKLLPLLLLLFSFIDFARADDSIYGLWQFESNAVYIEILEDGNTFQCRIAPGNVVITAKGKLVNGKSINWAPLIMRDINGKDITPEGISWGTDILSFQGSSLNFSGPYGEFAYKKCCSTLPAECR